MTQEGHLSEFLPIFLRNLLFTLTTLFVYRFWARTRVRQYLWGKTFINEDPLEYTGTARELIVGFLTTLLIVLTPFAILNFGLQLWIVGYSSLFVLLYVPIVVGLLFLIGFGLFRTRSFRLSRTQWRGIRFGQTGSSIVYGARVTLFALLTVVTLGWSIPLQDVVLAGYRINNTWFGDRKCVFAAGNWGLYGIFAPLYLLNGAAIGCIFWLAYMIDEQLGPAAQSAATLDLHSMRIIALFLALLFSYPFVLLFSIAAYKSARWRYYAKAITYCGVTPRFHISALGVTLLYLGNLVIRIATLNFAAPIVQFRNFRYFANRIQFDGLLDVDAIGQSQIKPMIGGEGLADAFDFGSI